MQENNENDFMKETIIDVAEHRGKYSAQAIKNFGNDMINNMSIKDSFNQFKNNMKSIANARQICLDNEYVYRTYKSKIIDGAKTVGSKVGTPIKSATTQTMSKIMNMVGKSYQNVVDKVTISRYEHLNEILKNRLNLKEAVSLGRLSYNPTKQIKSYDKQIAKLSSQLKKAKNKLRRSYLGGEISAYRSAKEYIISGELKKDVWKDKKSPEECFQNTIANAKGDIPKVKETIMTAMETSKKGILNTCSKVANTFVHIQNKIADIKISLYNNLATTISNISNFTTKQSINLQAATKSTSTKIVQINNNSKQIDEINKKIELGTLDMNTFASEKTKQIQKEIETINTLNNPDAAMLAQLRLSQSIAEDKKQLSSTIAKAEMSNTKDLGANKSKLVIQKASSAVVSQANTLLNKMNNVLIRCGQKTSNNKIKEVSFANKFNPDKITLKDLNKMTITDLNKFNMVDLQKIADNNDITFNIDNGKITGFDSNELENDSKEDI